MLPAMSSHVSSGIITLNGINVVCHERLCLFRNHSITWYLCSLPWAAMFVQESFHHMVFMFPAMSGYVCSGIIPSHGIYVPCHGRLCLFRNHSITWYLCSLPWAAMFVQESFHHMVFMFPAMGGYVCSGIIPSHGIYVICHERLHVCVFRNHSIKLYLCRLLRAVMCVHESLHQMVLMSFAMSGDVSSGIITTNGISTHLGLQRVTGVAFAAL